MRKLRRSVRIVDLEICILGFSGTHSIPQHIKCGILTSLWHSFFLLMKKLLQDFQSYISGTWLWGVQAVVQSHWAWLWRFQSWRSKEEVNAGSWLKEPCLLIFLARLFQDPRISFQIPLQLTGKMPLDWVVPTFCMAPSNKYRKGGK